MRIAVATLAAVTLIVGGEAPGVAKTMHKMAHAAFQLNSTSWQFTEKGKPMHESIDANGNFIVSSGAKHIDHGTAVMKAGKVCFTSAMTKDGEECWTARPTAIGATLHTMSDKGQKLAVKRVKYTPQKM
ncbi:MAG: hypothetical protein ABR588_05030 [Sphingomicrobium sp.]|nr:hypothetical protein [Sphingomonadales bacterium]